jgi:hypothetical protein
MEPKAKTRRLLDRLVAAARRTGADAATVCRQLPILNSCLPKDAEPVLVARASRPGDRASYLVLLTTRRLVVTRETRVLRRQHLHLNADPRHLIDVIWTPEPHQGAIALSATAVDGVREHFWIRTAAVEASAAALQRVFGREPVLV